MTVKIIFNETEYTTLEKLLEHNPNVYMDSTEKVLDDDKNVVGRTYFYKEYTEVQLNKFKDSKIRKEIKGLKLQLKELDFKSLKQVEAFLAGNDLPYTQEEFKVIADHKQELRNQINTLEGS